MSNEHFEPEDHMVFNLAHLKKEFVGSGIGGGIGILIGYPMDFIKVNLQFYPDKYKSAWHCFTSTVKQHGVKSLFRGCIPPVVTQGFSNSFLFMGEATAMRFLQPNLKRGETGTPINTFTSGLVGGLVQSVVSVPIEVIKCTMQATSETITPTTSSATIKQQSTNALKDTINCVRDIYAREGLFRGLFKGYFVTIARDVPSLGVYFCTYKYARDQITQYQQAAVPTHSAIIIGGGLAGAASWISVYPFDVMKTYCQVSPSSSSSSLSGGGMQPSYQDMSMRQVALSLYRRHGVRIFFSGLGVTVLRAFPVNAATFYFYEKITQYLHME